MSDENDRIFQFNDILVKVNPQNAPEISDDQGETWEQLPHAFAPTSPVVLTDRQLYIQKPPKGLHISAPCTNNGEKFTR